MNECMEFPVELQPEIGASGWFWDLIGGRRKWFREMERVEKEEKKRGEREKGKVEMKQV